MRSGSGGDGRGAGGSGGRGGAPVVTVAPEAVIAVMRVLNGALIAAYDHPLTPDQEVGKLVLAQAVLEAAAPHLAAAQREAGARLADQVGATYWNPDGSTQRLPFGALLRNPPEG